MRVSAAAAAAAAVVALIAAHPVLAAAPKVVTDLPAVHSLVAQVMGDRGAPVLLTERGANPHTMVLRPSQVRALAEADLVFWIGPEMTPWLDSTLDGLQPRGEVVGLLAAEGTFRQNYGATGAHDHDAGQDAGHRAGHGAGHDAGHGHAEAPSHGDAHGQAQAEGHGQDDAQGHGADHADGHDHAHAGVDPHAWLDPANARSWLALIAEELAARDAEHAATYRANAAAAALRITELDARIAATLAPVQGLPFVVFHDAYGYFAGHYGLTVAGSIALGDAAAPGAARLAELRAELAGGGAVCAFPEVQHDVRLVAAVTEGTAVRIGATLDPSGTSLEPGPGLYEALLTGIAYGIAACLKAEG